MDQTPELEVIFASLESLLELAAGVEAGLRRGTASGEEEEALDQHVRIVARLQGVGGELRDIVLAYAKHAKSESPGPSPLDPMLCDWIAECAARVLCVQEGLKLESEEQQGEVEGSDDNGNEDEDWMIIDKENKLQEDDDTVESLVDSLVDVPEEEGEEIQSVESLQDRFLELREHIEHLEGFLPILKADFNDFLATNISQTQFPHEPPQQLPHHEAGVFSSTASSSGNNLIELRFRLYDLSDELKTSQHLLTSYSAIPSLTKQAKAELQLLKEMQALTVAALAELLSNNGSEWIESMLAGNMTFAEFQALDQDEITGFRSEIRTRNKELNKVVSMADHGRQRTGSGEAPEAAEMKKWRERVESFNWILKIRKLE